MRTRFEVAGGGIPYRPHMAADTRLVIIIIIIIIIIISSSSSSSSSNSSITDH